MEVDSFITQEITTLKGYSRFHYTAPDPEAYIGDDVRYRPVLEWVVDDWNSDRKYVVDVFSGNGSIAFEVNEEGDKEFRRLFGHTLR